MKRIVFDIETNGFLKELDRVHCLAAQDPDTGEKFSFTPENIPAGIELLSKADVVIGHNALRFDVPAISKVFRGFKSPTVRDTLLLARLYHPDIKNEIDFKLNKEGKLPAGLIGKHSLESWGYRLGQHKGDFKGPWDQWTPEMQTYCEQDVEVTTNLLRRFDKIDWGTECVELEHDLAHIIGAQEDYGFLFDQPAAAALYASLSEKRHALETTLKQAFGGWWEKEKVIPKANNKTKGIQKDVPYWKTKWVEFNPSSRAHIIKRLIHKYQWEPKVWSESNQPTIDEDVLMSLPYPEAKMLAEYFLIEKRIAQLSEGKTGWMRLVGPDGRMHGRIVTNGTPTGRATHSSPNMSQVPSVSKPYGKECRALFTVPAGKSLVGVDVSGLELRMLAHYLARYDGGDFAKVVTEGDIHSENWKAAPNLIQSRTMAKPVIYAMIYGAQDPKLGEIVGGGREAGAKLRSLLYARYTGLDRITKLAQEAARSKKYLVGLDGRHMPVRSQHAALNTLLQGAGGVLCKKWIVTAHRMLEQRGLAEASHQVAWSHDEIQIEAPTEIADEVGKTVVEAIAVAQAAYKVRCPLTGEYKVGKNWADTH